MAELVERSLPTPEVRSGSNPVIRQIYLKHFFTVGCIEKAKIKKRRGRGMAHHFSACKTRDKEIDIEIQRRS